MTIYNLTLTMSVLSLTANIAIAASTPASAALPTTTNPDAEPGCSTWTSHSSITPLPPPVQQHKSVYDILDKFGKLCTQKYGNCAICT